MENIHIFDETGVSSNVSHFAPPMGQSDPFERNVNINYRKKLGSNYIKIELQIGSLKLLAKHSVM
jgi:hypothetical protein